MFFGYFWFSRNFCFPNYSIKSWNFDNQRSQSIFKFTLTREKLKFSKFIWPVQILRKVPAVSFIVAFKLGISNSRAPSTFKVRPLSYNLFSSFWPDYGKMHTRNWLLSIFEIIMLWNFEIGNISRVSSGFFWKSMIFRRFFRDHIYISNVFHSRKFLWLYKKKIKLFSLNFSQQNVKNRWLFYDFHDPFGNLWFFHDLHDPVDFLICIWTFPFIFTKSTQIYIFVLWSNYE